MKSQMNRRSGNAKYKLKLFLSKDKFPVNQVTIKNKFIAFKKTFYFDFFKIKVDCSGSTSAIYERKLRLKLKREFQSKEEINTINLSLNLKLFLLISYTCFVKLVGYKQ